MPIILVPVFNVFPKPPNLPVVFIIVLVNEPNKPVDPLTDLPVVAKDAAAPLLAVALTAASAVLIAICLFKEA